MTIRKTKQGTWLEYGCNKNNNQEMENNKIMIQNKTQI
jgi:hypothetical protein